MQSGIIVDTVSGVFGGCLTIALWDTGCRAHAEVVVTISAAQLRTSSFDFRFQVVWRAKRHHCRRHFRSIWRRNYDCALRHRLPVRGGGGATNEERAATRPGHYQLRRSPGGCRHAQTNGCRRKVVCLPNFLSILFQPRRASRQCRASSTLAAFWRMESSESRQPVASGELYNLPRLTLFPLPKKGRPPVQGVISSGGIVVPKQMAADIR